jgi:hypothetical protein
VVVRFPSSISSLYTIGDMQPGDSSTRSIYVTNDVGVDFAYTLTVEATTSSLLDTDPVNGLQLMVLRCDASYALCDQIVYQGAAIVTDLDVGGPQAVGTGDQGVANGRQDFIQLRFTLPTGAGNAFANQSSVFRITWTATQAL